MISDIQNLFTASVFYFSHFCHPILIKPSILSLPERGSRHSEQVPRIRVPRHPELCEGPFTAFRVTARISLFGKPQGDSPDVIPRNLTFCSYRLIKKRRKIIYRAAFINFYEFFG